MYAILGEVEFDLITYFDGLEAQFGVDYARHQVIQGKPKLQWVGEKLDELRIDLTFHAGYCEPEAELLRLRKAMNSRRAMQLVFGNGDYKGWFVITDIQAVSRQTDTQGGLIALTARMNLTEFAGATEGKPARPGLRQYRAPVQAVARRASIAGVPGHRPLPTVNGSPRLAIRQSVSLFQQAGSALAGALELAQFARRLATDPAAALARLPGLRQGLAQTEGPLSQLGDSLSGIPGLPALPDLLSNTSQALGAVRDARGLADGAANPQTVAADLSGVLGHLDRAQGAMTRTAPSLARLAAEVGTRRV